MKEQMAMFAAYNQWANAVVYRAAHQLNEEELNSNRGAFFGSLIGTLNHLLCADRIWMRRFTGAGDAPKTLNTVLHPDLGSLEDARKKEDTRIIGWIDGLGEKTIAANFTYVPVSTPKPVTQRLGSAMFHFFNHQTHHRGQCHMILTGLGQPSVTLDLVSFQRLHESGKYL